MRDFTIAEVREAVGGILLTGSNEGVIRKICTDSRKAEPGDLFFPLIGENNDGHDFLAQVFEKGCRSIIVSDESKIPRIEFLADGMQPDVILVEDTTKALQDLAQYYLSTLPMKKKIAVTGSVGKTSTRDMMYYIASMKYKTGRNLKNFNNGFGLPLSILEFAPDTEAAVLEMGMDHFGQIEILANLVKPDIALITNIGISHIENLGSREGILKAKMEVTSCFDENSTLVVNSDCDLLCEENVKGNYKLITVGSQEGNDYRVSDVFDFGDKGIKYTLRRKEKAYTIFLPIPGAHNAVNASLAIAAGEQMGIDIATAIRGLETAQLTEKRLNIKEKNGIKVIDDTYNACPASVMSALNTLMQTEGKRKIAIIGDMYELGQETENAHKEVGAFAGGKKPDLLVCIGDFAKGYAEGAAEHMQADRILYFSEKEEFLKRAQSLLEPGDVILVKASRGMQMEKIVEEILKEQTRL